MKIVGFKLNLRVREIQRRAKKAEVDLSALSLEEAALEKLLKEASKAIAPAVLFDTFSHPDPDQPLLSPLPGLAYSLVLATLGEAWTLFKRQAQETQPRWERIWPTIEETALEDCVRFAASLLEDEALKESCELSPITRLGGAAALDCALKKLGGAKIGVSLAEDRLNPSRSAVCSLSWLSKSKVKGKSKT